MARGGARNRSGPPADPNSERSERRGFKLTALPAEGYQGPIPDFPLPNPTARELEEWAGAWRTPQACAWMFSAERWRFIRQVANYVRLQVICESPDARSSDRALLPRYEDRIGFSTAGLAEMGWKVATDEVGERSATKQEGEAKPRQSSRDRMKVVSGG